MQLKLLKVFCRKEQSPEQASLQGRANHELDWSLFPTEMQDSLERRAWLGKIKEF